MLQQLFGLVEECHGAFVGERVVDELPLALPGHETALGETGQMHRGVGLTQAGASDDFPGAQRAVTQCFEDPQSRHVSKPPKELGAELDSPSDHING